MRHQHLRGTRLALLSGVCSLGFWAMAAQPAAAQASSAPEAKSADATQVGEIVVTARKRNERLRDVPVSASVVDASAIADRGGLQGVRDLVTTVPSVALGDTSTPLTSEISIRGSGTSRGTSADSGVGLYRDGAYIGGGAQGGRTFSRFDLFDASQIEVLRGNQGALYGRDAVGGAINVITARPQMNNSGFATVRGGDKSLIEYEAVVNQQLSDHFAVRLSADVMKQPKGFYCAPAIDYCIDSQSEEGYRAQFRYENDRADANLMFEHSKNKYPGLNLQLWVQPTASFPQGVFLEDQFTRHHNFRDNDTDQVNDAEFNFNYRFDFATLTSVTLWRDRKDSQQFDQDLEDQTLLNEIVAAGLIAKGVALPDINTSQQNHGETKSFNQELYLAGKVGEKWNWLVGGEYVGLSDADVITTGRTPTKANPSIGAQRPSSQTLKSWAAYGSLEYDVTDALSVTGEVRYTDDKKSFSGSAQDLTSLVVSSVVSASTTPTNTSWDLTASYKLGPEWMVYGKVGTAFRAGGFNANLGVPQQPIPVPAAYGNENATSYELGAKGNPISAIYLTAAIYRTQVDNLIIQTDNGCKATNPVCPQVATTFATNGGRAWVEGAELEATAHADVLGGSLTGTIGGSWQKGDITSGQFAGDIPPQLPKYLASADVNYSHPLFGMTGFANLVYSARWGGVQEIAQTPELHDYQLFNGRTGLRTGPWEFAAFMNNIGDLLYIQFDATSARRWSEPRTYGVEASYKW